MSDSMHQDSSTQMRQGATFESIYVGGDVGLRAKILFVSCWKEGDSEPGTDETIIINADECAIRRAATEKIWNAQSVPLREDEVRAYQTTVTMKEDGFIATFQFEPRSTEITNHRGEPIHAYVEIGAESKGGGKGKTPQEWMEGSSSILEAEREIERNRRSARSTATTTAAPYAATGTDMNAVRNFLEANGEVTGIHYLQAMDGRPPLTSNAPEPFTGRSQQLTAIDSDDQEVIEDMAHRGLLGDTHILQTENKPAPQEGNLMPNKKEQKTDATWEARTAANAAMQEAYEEAEQFANSFLKKHHIGKTQGTSSAPSTCIEDNAAEVTTKQKDWLDQDPALAQAIENSLNTTEGAQTQNASSRGRLPSARGSTCFLMDEINQLNMQRDRSPSQVSSMGAKHESDNESLQIVQKPSLIKSTPCSPSFTPLDRTGPLSSAVLGRICGFLLPTVNPIYWITAGVFTVNPNTNQRTC